MLTVARLRQSAVDGLRLRSDPSFLSSTPTSTSRSVNTQRTLQLRLDTEPCDSCSAHSRCAPVLPGPGQRPPAREPRPMGLPRFHVERRSPWLRGPFGPRASPRQDGERVALGRAANGPSELRRFGHLAWTAHRGRLAPPSLILTSPPETGDSATRASLVSIACDTGKGARGLSMGAPAAEPCGRAAGARTPRLCRPVPRAHSVTRR